MALIACLLAIDRVTALMLDFAYAHSGASPLAQVRAANADTVVVGTSTAKYAFFPKSWPSQMVNIAQDGQTVLFSIGMAVALRDSPNVKRIIVGIDPYDLRSGLDNPSAVRIWRIAPLIYKQPEIASLLERTRPATQAPISLASWRFRGSAHKVIERIGRNAPPPYRSLPQGEVEIPVLDRTPPKQKPRIHPSLHEYLLRLHDVLIASGQQLVLVVTPAYLNLRWDLPDQTPLLDELVARLSGVKLCDLTKLETEQYKSLIRDPENFHDNIHLTRKGAKRYTKFIARSVESSCPSSVH